MKAKKRDPNRPPKFVWKHLDRPLPKLDEIPSEEKKVHKKKNLGQNRNSRKMYVCKDCEKRQLIHWLERLRAKKIQCKHCGSFHLEPASVGAHLELFRENENLLGINLVIKKPESR